MKIDIEKTDIGEHLKKSLSEHDGMLFNWGNPNISSVVSAEQFHRRQDVLRRIGGEAYDILFMARGIAGLLMDAMPDRSMEMRDFIDRVDVCLGVRNEQ